MAGAAVTPAHPWPRAAGAERLHWPHSSPAHLPSALPLALQDELSHINARLNMGILGCEYGPAMAPTCPPPGPQLGLHPLLPSLQPTTLSRSSSAKGPLWATRALCGVSASTPWVTCSSVAPLTRPSRWAGSYLSLCSLAGLGTATCLALPACLWVGPSGQGLLPWAGLPHSFLSCCPLTLG